MKAKMYLCVHLMLRYVLQYKNHIKKFTHPCTWVQFVTLDYMVILSLWSRSLRGKLYIITKIRKKNTVDDVWRERRRHKAGRQTDRSKRWEMCEKQSELGVRRAITHNYCFIPHTYTPTPPPTSISSPAPTPPVHFSHTPSI